MNDSPAAVIVDSNGNLVEVVQVPIGPENDRYLGTAGVQHTVASVNNTSNVNLTAGASFTGGADSCAGVASIQVMLTADQPVSVEVQQSTDATNWDVFDRYDIPANYGDARTFQAVSTYVRVIAVNVGPVATTSFRLSTIFTPAMEALPRSLTSTGALKLSQATVSTTPDPHNFTEVGNLPALQQDYEGHTIVRGPVLTDEGSFRTDFDGATIYESLTGTCYFRAGTSRVVGVGTSFLSEAQIGQYLKLDVDGDAVVGTIEDVLSDTDLILAEPYAGSTGNGTGDLSDWIYDISAGGSIALVSSVQTLSSGTTSGEITSSTRTGDYLPFTLNIGAKCSQRIANQELGFGFLDGPPDTTAKRATVVFSGTDDTQVIFRTSSSFGQSESTTVALPNGLTSAGFVDYQIELKMGGAQLFVNGVLVATHERYVPGPYDLLDIKSYVWNTGAAASSTDLELHSAWFANYNVVQIAVANGEVLPVKVAGASGADCTNVAAAVADTLLLAANTSRRGMMVTNDSSAFLYLKCGSGASPTSYTVKIPPDGYYEMPFNYDGAVYGYWSAASGTARVTEVL